MLVLMLMPLFFANGAILIVLPGVLAIMMAFFPLIVLILLADIKDRLKEPKQFNLYSHVAIPIREIGEEEKKNNETLLSRVSPKIKLPVKREDNGGEDYVRYA